MRSFVLLIAGVFAGFADDRCTVTEHRFDDTASGHFSIGQATVDLTIPLNLFDEEWLAMVISSKGDTAGLSIESVEETIPLRNSAVLETVSRRGQRPGFSILNRDRERLCTWQPEVFPIQLRRTPLPYEWLTARQRLSYRKIGEPVVFLTEGTTPSDTDIFRIEGAQMTILAYTRDQMILRDPNPSLGLRRIRGESYDVTFRFIETRIALTGHSQTRKTADITVRGLETLSQPAMLKLDIRNPEAAHLGCGRISNSDSRLIRFSPADIRSGVFHCTCPIALIQSGEDTVIDARVFELPPKPTPAVLRRYPW
jgi:hypothetical protein